jgi:hypothetical protein
MFVPRWSLWGLGFWALCQWALFLCQLGAWAQPSAPPNFSVKLPVNTLRIHEPSEGIFLNTTSGQLQLRLADSEKKLYGHPYAEEGTERRLARLEKTLFGGGQSGTPETRYLRVMEKMKHYSVAQSVTEQGSIVGYLENRFYQKNFPEMSLEHRTRQLEQYVYGKTNDNEAVSTRIKRLTYTVPLTAKEIRLTGTDGHLIATTRPKTEVPSLKVVDLVAPPVVMTSFNVTPPLPPAPESDKNYLESIFKLPNDKVLRWTHLPVRVAVQNHSHEELDVSVQAIAAWGRTYPVKFWTEPSQADIILDWAFSGTGSTGTGPSRISSLPSGTAPSLSAAGINQGYALRDSGVPRYITRPVVRMDDSRTIRNVIWVGLSPYKNQSNPRKKRAVLHQLGHASGMWGHSENPHDVMYPIGRLEATDFPDQWNQSIVRFSTTVPEPALLSPNDVGVVSLSQRDINTMVQLYQLPGEDLRLFKEP